MSTDPTTYKNDNISITCSTKPGCRVHLDVIVTPQATLAAYHKAIKSISKEVSIPGFRKGKAPEAMILKNFAKHVDKEWRDTLLNTAFDESIRLSKIYPFNKDSIKSASIKSISKENGAVLVFEYESMPEIPAVTPEDLTIPTVNRKNITEKDVSQALEDLCLQRAEWLDISDRPVQEGDYVDIDIDAIEQDRKLCEKARFAVSSDKMGAWMRRILIGMSPGQSAESMSEKDESDCNECAHGDHEGHEHHHHQDFVPTLCKITLHSIKQAKAPELNDELAKQYGAGNVEELKERVTASLNKKADESQKNTLRAMMEQALLQKYPFDIPYSLVQDMVEERKQAILDDLKARGVPEESTKAEAEKTMSEALHQLERNYRIYFLTQKIAQAHNIKIEQEELMQELMRQMWLQQMGQSSIDTSMDPKEMQAQLQLQLLTVKTLDFLLNR